MSDKEGNNPLPPGYDSSPPIPVPQIEAQNQDPKESTSNAENKSEGGFNEINPLVTPKINPFKTPVVLDCLKAVSGVEDLKGLRELSILHHKSFGKAYFDKLNKSLTFTDYGIDYDPEYHNWEFLPVVSSEDVHTFRQIFLNLSWSMDNLILPEVLGVLKSIAPYLVKMQVVIQVFDKEITRLSPNLASMFRQVPDLNTSLSEFAINVNDLAFGGIENLSSIVPEYRNMLGVLPQNIKIAINYARTNVPYIVEASNSYPIKNQILEHRTANFQWYKDNHLKCNQVMMELEDFDFDNNEFGILTSFDKLIATFNEDGLMTLRISQVFLMMKHAKFDLLGRSLDLCNWKQNISELVFYQYVHPLLSLHDFPKLTEISLWNSDLDACLFSNFNLTDEENLNQVFGGLENLKANLNSSQEPCRVRPDNHLALYIQTLVRQLKFRDTERRAWDFHWEGEWGNEEEAGEEEIEDAEEIGEEKEWDDDEI